MDGLDLVEACERRIVNAWPAPATLLVEDWVLRFANGYSGRANSASPLRRDAKLAPAALDFVEARYREAGLPPCVRITPLADPAARELIAARGYRIKDASIGMAADLTALPEASDDAFRHEPAAGPGWIEAVAARQEGNKRHVGNLTAIVSAIRLPAAFASLWAEGAPVAFCMSVAERGMAEIGLVVVDAARRGNGLGRRLVAGAMRWARDAGCHSSYLQVEKNNAVAIGLYGSLGFREVYRYETWVKD